MRSVLRRLWALGARRWIGPALLLTIAFCGLPACKNVCQKFADHLEDCRQDYCQSRSEHPICGDRYAERDNTVDDCPDVIAPIVESQLDKDCATLAREMGWEALGAVPAPRANDE